MGLSNGVLLTTGDVGLIPGPNDVSDAGLDLSHPGDADISALVGGDPTLDGCAVEFDFVCISDTVEVGYVFGSEEYLEFVGTSFNDHFAFFISGPGIVGTENIALLPGTSVSVGINNVNVTSYSAFYVDNTGGMDIEYDGHTTLLTAKHAVTPGSTYHIKLVIADVFDGIYDSGVFLEGHSFRSGVPLMTLTAGAPDLIAVEGCAGGSASFSRTEGIADADTITYSVTGTASNGIDYALLGGELIFAAGDSTATLLLDATLDGISEGTESVTVHFLAATSGSFLVGDSVTFTVYDRVPCEAGADALLCIGDNEVLGGAPTAGISYSWSPTFSLSDPTVSNPTVTATVDTTIAYLLTSTDRSGCASTDTVNVVMSTCTGVLNSVIDRQILLYPVPADDHLKLALPHPLEHGVMIDATGRTVYSLAPGRMDYQLAVVERLPAGLYFLHLTIMGSQQVKPFVVTH
jgi:hypothetical protein